jgi:hypothetical protein
MSGEGLIVEEAALVYQENWGKIKQGHVDRGSKRSKCSENLNWWIFVWLREKGFTK